MDNQVDDGTALGWRHLYEAAVLELDRQRLPGRIEQARQAVLKRLESVKPTNHAETEALTNALQVLQDLHKIDAEDGRPKSPDRKYAEPG